MVNWCPLHILSPPIAMAGIARFRGKRTILTTTAASAILWHCLLRWYFSRCCQVIVQSHPGSSVCTQHGRMYSWWVLAGSTAEGVIKCWVSHLLLTAAYQTSNDLPFHTRPSSAPSQRYETPPWPGVLLFHERVFNDHWSVQQHEFKYFLSSELIFEIPWVSGPENMRYF